MITGGASESTYALNSSHNLSVIRNKNFCTHSFDAPSIPYFFTLYRASNTESSLRLLNIAIYSDVSFINFYTKVNKNFSRLATTDKHCLIWEN